MKTKRLCTFPNESEQLWGYGWWLLQLLILPTLFPAVNRLLGSPLNDAELNFCFFLLNFVAVLWIFHRFLEVSFRSLKKHFIDTVQSTILGLAGYLVTLTVLTGTITLLLPGYANLNNAAISGLMSADFGLTVIGTVLLTPVAEEVFYRGLLFGSCYRKSRLLAYLLSAFVFCAIHVLPYWGQLSRPAFFLSMLQYLPAGIWLAWSYTKSGNLFAPIFIHSLANLLAMGELR